MSNSSLITYTNLTKRYSTRKSKITKITIHHMAGKMTAKECCDYFATGDREVSANYCIGYDGSVGLSVDEQNRAWTTGVVGNPAGAENDHMAVTIEVSNDGGVPDWHVSDKALEATIELCADICKRNGIKKLNYTGTTAGNLTRHDMFKATACPGPYLGGKFPYIAEQVNKKLAGATTGTVGDKKDKKGQTETKTTTKASGFLPARGYFKKGDCSPNIGKIAAFMLKVFPSYTNKKAAGNTYGAYLVKAIKEFQKRTGLEADGYIGPLTLAKLKTFGFSEE